MIVGTAGHVDHGKSTVVRLLTGSDPDRWPEEHRRGLTIGLGFGFVDLSGPPELSRQRADRGGTGNRQVDGARIGVVDVPGHGKFLPTMLQGAHALDVALLVVAAHEGWMPQTAEHVAVLDALGTPTGVVVITYVDRAGDALVDEVCDDLRQRLAGTFLAGAIEDPSRTVRVNGRTGAGLVELRHALAVALADAVANPHRGSMVDHGRPRLWVDRSFGLRGVGHVSTGTVTGGDLGVGDPIDVSHRGRVGGQQRSRVASIQVHTASVQDVSPRHRVGIRLAGKAARPEVGDALVVASQWRFGRHCHAAVRAFEPGTELVQRSGYDLVLGTGRWAVELRGSPNVPGPLRPVGSSSDEPAWDPVRLHASQPVGPVAPGDRFVLVDTSTSRAVAGGVLLAVDVSVVRRDQGSLERRLTAVLARNTDQLAAALVAECGPVLRTKDVLAEMGCIPDCLHPDGRRGFRVRAGGGPQGGG